VRVIAEVQGGPTVHGVFSPRLLRGRRQPAEPSAEFIQSRPKWTRAEGEANTSRLVPTGVFSVAAAGHRAVITRCEKEYGAAGRIVLEHGVGAERALAAEGQLFVRIDGRAAANVHDQYYGGISSTHLRELTFGRSALSARRHAPVRSGQRRIFFFLHRV